MESSAQTSFSTQGGGGSSLEGSVRRGQAYPTAGDGADMISSEVTTSEGSGKMPAGARGGVNDALSSPEVSSLAALPAPKQAPHHARQISHASTEFHDAGAAHCWVSIMHYTLPPLDCLPAVRSQLTVHQRKTVAVHDTLLFHPGSV